jgi:hypothetical protein
MLISHILFSLLFLYISWSIITKNYPEQWVGYLLLLTVVLMITAHIYTYTRMNACKKSGDPEKFCNCYGSQTRKTCPNRAELDELYRTGVLTEYTDLAKQQDNLNYLK